MALMTQSGPRAEHRVASRRSPPAVKTAAGHNLELTALRRQAAGPAGAARLRSAKLELQMVAGASDTITAGNLLRATSGNGRSLACIVIGAAYLPATRGMGRAPTEAKPPAI